MTKRVRDIEWLLQWAIRDELKKGRQVRRRGRPSAVIPSAWDSITNYHTLGTRIDVSRRSRDPFDLALGAPHDDARAGEPHDDAKAGCSGGERSTEGTKPRQHRKGSSPHAG